LHLWDKHSGFETRGDLITALDSPSWLKTIVKKYKVELETYEFQELFSLLGLDLGEGVLMNVSSVRAASVCAAKLLIDKVNEDTLAALRMVNLQGLTQVTSNQVQAYVAPTFHLAASGGTKITEEYERAVAPLRSNLDGTALPPAAGLADLNTTLLMGTPHKGSAQGFPGLTSFAQLASFTFQGS